MSKMPNIKTLGALKKSSYQSKALKDEMRDNLILKLRKKEKIFSDILGFEETVIPDLERAILSRHNILLLGLRGQAKTKIARLMIQLLDDYIPVIQGSELNDDPLQPISREGIEMVKKHGDKTPISWMAKEDRYVEKLATPDVSISDLIGDVDPIKAAAMKLSYSDERVIHFGLVPRSHRSIFVINELPDLQARIQVSLFNILQEGDIQIRGFKLRLPLDIQFVFTANPEDYTNRGSIITPLKDRIESQILTHYPKTIEVAQEITQQEAKLSNSQKEHIHLPDLLKELIEQVAFEARESDLVDEKSGISARLSISAYENLVSAAERRMILNGEKSAVARVSDFWGVIPAITGKVELVYEGEQLGPYGVALELIRNGVKKLFIKYFSDPNKIVKDASDPFAVVKMWFGAGHEVFMLNDEPEKDFKKKLKSIQGLEKLIASKGVNSKDKFIFMELALHAFADFEIISKEIVDNQLHFSDPLKNLWGDLDSDS